MTNLAKNPFSKPPFVRNSNLFKSDSNKTLIEDIFSSNRVKEIHHKLVSFINSNHPCLGAHSVFNKNNYYLGVYDSLGSESSTCALSRDLMQFVIDKSPKENKLYSFIAVFPDNSEFTEEQFENNLWTQLSKLHTKDKEFHKWDTSVSSNPIDPNFSFSFGEKAFYVIGMHPNSSRKARQFEYPMIIFNYHEQFERLRNTGVYSKMKEKIRARDTEYSGSVNPMLEDFGRASEAKQYSGRQVDEKWKCPFINNQK